MPKALVIVESPAKARTISKFLGKEWMVEASIGHVRDLPSKAAEIPPEIKDKAWGRMAIDVDDGYQPYYVVSQDKKAIIRGLKSKLKEANALYLATDEDREGEAISWHLLELLQPKVPVRRMVFHEITKAAIDAAVESCREIDTRLVNAQEARRILDRLYGYEVSPVLWRKIAPRLSAGRVQSVATRLIVERERERMAFVPAAWWDATLELEHGGARFPANVTSVDGHTLAQGRDFGPDGKLTGGRKVMILDEERAGRLARGLDRRPTIVRKVEEKEYVSSPKPPFTTSTLQQEAGRKLGMAARRTMQAAQRLYENGYITYMRTDSIALSGQALNAARELVAARYGAEYLPAKPRTFKGKSRNAQEAHEAIRPAGERFRLPEEVARELEGDDARLYDLIWKRTVASQMVDARMQSVAATMDCELAEVEGPTSRDVLTSNVAGQAHAKVAPFKKAELVARGRTVLFDGFLRAYVEGRDPSDEADDEAVLPPLRQGDQPRVARALATGHTTKPPARYTEAGLVQKLEELGIGRPSTYASIIATILDREYCTKRGPALVPTPLAFAVVQLITALEASLVDYSFTAEMEEDLDAIARGELDRLQFLDQFYKGKKPGLREIVTQRMKSIDPKAVCTVHLGEHEGESVDLRVGRFGPYIESGGRRANCPADLAPDEITTQKALELLETAGKADEPLGFAPDGQPVFVRTGAYGPYVQLGATTDDKKHKPKRASLFKDMDPRTITLEEALQLLSLPRLLGADEAGNEIRARPGRFGPYLEKTVAGAEKPETRSLKEERQLLTVTLAEALELYSRPKYGGRGRGQGSGGQATLKELGVEPESGARILLKDGRYGPYVTDGTTNASLAKGADTEQLTLQAAIELLIERRKSGPSKKPRKFGARKAGARKAGAPKAASKAGGKPAPRKKPSPKPAPRES